MSRRLLSLLLVCACSTGAVLSRAAETEFLRVWPGWRQAEAFDRIGEYFGGREDHGRQVVLRTRATERAGYYFLTRIKSAAAVPEARFELHVIRPHAPEPVLYTFVAPGGEAVHPVAWKISVRDGTGRVLAEHKSFLWEKPAK
jgi:hypothetical protein